MKASRPPRNGHTVLDTRDVDAAEQALSQCYLPLRLRPIASVATLDTRVNAVALGRATVGAIRFDSEVGIRTEPAANVHIDIPLSGTAVANPSSTRPLVTRPGSAQVFMPGERGDLRWSAGTRQLCVMVEQDALEQELAALLGEEVARPLMFRADMDLRGSAGGTWRHVIALLQHELRRDDGLFGHTIMRRTVERLLVESLLLSHRHNYSDQLHRVQAGATTTNIGTAIALVESYPERPWTTASLAVESGMSVRALHAGFRRQTSLSPMAYLRGVRLARVHAELCDANPSTTTIAHVARRWGFAHLGRFAAAYSERYGHSPSSTLRNVRRDA